MTKGWQTVNQAVCVSQYSGMTLMKDQTDERQHLTTQMKDHPDERPEWWETTPHDPDERPPWQKTRLMRDNTPYKAICFCSFFFVKTFPSRLHAKETRYKAPLKTLLLDF